MFVPSTGEECAELIKRCHELVAEHNKVSYRKVVFDRPVVEFRFIDHAPKSSSLDGVRDPAAEEIIAFYEWYSSAAIAEHSAELLAEQTAYTSEDIAFHLDRSPDAVVQILATLTEGREQLSECQARLASNLTREVSAFTSYVVESVVCEDTRLDEAVIALFDCMAQKNLDKRMSGGFERLRCFIDVGFALLRELARQGHITIALRELVEAKNNELKDIVLGVQIPFSPEVAGNRMQRFGVVPDERNNATMHELLSELFGLTVAPMPDVALCRAALTNAMKMVSVKTGVPTGLVLMLSPTQDIYFNMAPLLNEERSGSDATGVTKKTVAYFNTRHEGNAPRVEKAETMLVNVDPRQTDRAFVMWSNDRETFKVRAAPVGRVLIEKLLRREPSATVANYNALLAAKIISARPTDAVSYNYVQYMSFMNEVTEKSFLDALQEKLVKCADSEVIDTVDADAWAVAVVGDSFTHELYATIDSCKSEFGVSEGSIPAHSHIIFAAMANKIVQGIKKGLLRSIQEGIIYAQQEPEDRTKALNTVVSETVRTNDNIYTRVIAGYHLQRS